MKKQLLPVLFSLLVLGTINTYSQNIGFDYDDAGNRVSRYVLLSKSTETGSRRNNDKQQEYGETINKVAVKILPNPNGGKFSVNISGKDSQTLVKLYLFDISGKAIYKNERAASRNEINISNRKNGTYLLHVIVDDKKRTWKIIKR